jgi:hypothetical protein
MSTDMKSIHALATAALESLKLAIQQNADRQSRTLMLAALAQVALLREQAAAELESGATDPAEYCFPV